MFLCRLRIASLSLSYWVLDGSYRSYVAYVSLSVLYPVSREKEKMIERRCLVVPYRFPCQPGKDMRDEEEMNGRR